MSVWFLAYLRGIETFFHRIAGFIEFAFLAYLRGIETMKVQGITPGMDAFLAYLRGIETTVPGLSLILV